MKGNLMLRVLGTVEKKDITSMDLLGAFLSAGYRAPRSKVEYLARKNQQARIRNQKEYDTYKQYCNLLYRLRRDGLIQISFVNSKKMVSITPQGHKWLSFSRKHSHQKFFMINPVMKKNKNPIVIIFDIPENKRVNRKFLRAALKTIGFRMLQKSVWIGEFDIPKELIDYLYHLKIIDYVQIFEISRTGNLDGSPQKILPPVRSD
jgi:DNA-binding PadR family transcriptional regulator